MPVSDQGVFSDRYKIIPRVLVFATREGSVLLLKGAPTKRLWANLYNGVGGHVEKGEDVLSAAQREFNEETGLDLVAPWLCAVVTIDTKEVVGIGMYVFRGEIHEGDPRPSKEGSLEWFPYDKISTVDLVEDLPLLLPRLLDMQRGEPPLSALYFYDDKDELNIVFGKSK